ncbi:dihydrodipicolinate synthase family protein [Isoptericola sp. NEAU-Y5]|uniref:Dihydrodipicolinate synthase family protein n=1 Tax=Isoptericola luteus TaxID=2879484 RepID=A0ABS7ZEP6_9MICO|nr:dihydrodipicolinate synthase family protein [Isoptericola sp. NEAU-Y5]MCA5892279.1 dihydrodipicolinate synthase family protein [Isoptericola sp. NEAU-Y5]
MTPHDIARSAPGPAGTTTGAVRLATRQAPQLEPSGVTVRLPRFDDAGRATGVEVRELNAPGPWVAPSTPITSRVAFAAAHVVPQVGAENVPGAPAVVDWDATLAYRHEIWRFGLGVADAMDTAQRGMGLDWAATQELVRRSSAEAASVGARIACGAGTDQLDPAVVAAWEPGDPAALAAVTDAYREQVHVVQDAGAQVIVMASRALARVARSPEDYARVYDAVLAEADRPVVLHWLGTMFDPALAGYWGSASVESATATFLDLIRAHQDRVDGVKVSLLDAQHEIGLRRSLAALDGSPVRLYTGDDFNYPELIAGDDQGHSDALLGIFAAVYPAASTALQAFDAGAAGDPDGAGRGHAVLASTEKLGRHIFAAPTYYYKTGVAFLSWLNGFQPGFQLVGGLQAGRSLAHLVELARLADGCGMLLDPALAARRLDALLTTNGATA